MQDSDPKVLSISISAFRKQWAKTWRKMQSENIPCMVERYAMPECVIIPLDVERVPLPFQDFLSSTARTTLVEMFDIGKRSRDPLLSISASDLRQYGHDSLTKIRQANEPFFFTRYDDVVGILFPLPILDVTKARAKVKNLHREFQARFLLIRNMWI